MTIEDSTASILSHDETNVADLTQYGRIRAAEKIVGAIPSGGASSAEIIRRTGMGHRVVAQTLTLLAEVGALRTRRSDDVRVFIDPKKEQ